ncbi:MAG: hypothetical protein F6K55_22515 [Moorea sp. SIO4A3]|nr:hypothetical protein [Moorena sp. SIO4A3]
MARKNLPQKWVLGGNHTPHLTDFLVQAVKTARVVVPPWSKDTGHPDSRLFPVTRGLQALIYRLFSFVYSQKILSHLREGYTKESMF